MAQCASCKNEAPENGSYCPFCGAPLAPLTSAPTESGVSGDPEIARSDSGPDPGRFIPGVMIGGRYRMVGLLGRGGMGEVYRADDLKLGQPVALKFLPGDVVHDRARLDRFLNEVRTALKVTHTNVCRVHDVGEIDGQHYLSMEYVDGEDLGSLLRRIGRLPEDKAIQIARQLCAGLAAAHEQQILHRDLKPANVMIDGRGRAKLTDFGLAGLAESIEGDEVRAGTPLYMSPEQHEGREVTVRSDIYSLGLILYELFTGRRAFEAATPAELQRLRAESTPTSPSHHVEGLDPAVERTILRCLEPDPQQRPASARAVAASLPGGDPLAAALAAGETPSPEMVADAGAGGGLHPAMGVTLLVFVLAGLLATATNQGRFSVPGRVSLPKPPEALVVEAREVLEFTGRDDKPMDHAYGFIYDMDYFDSVEAQDPVVTTWDDVATIRPAPIQFWYRESPQYLVAANFFTGYEIRYVSPSDPPWTLENMTGVWLDPQGRLLRLMIVPPPFDTVEASKEDVDWAPYFEAAGLDLSRFTPSTPKRNPLVTCDARLAWEGGDPEQFDESIRVEACSYGGRPAHFEIIPPWREYSWHHTETPSVTVDDLVFTVFLFVLVIGGSLLARRNLRLGRGDRRGAFRVTLFVFLLAAFSWVVQAHHVLALSEIGLLFSFLGFGLVTSGLVWIVYIALEPFARRLWPHGLISWSRLLSGRARDPLVGRDILIGATAGLFNSSWWALYDLVVDRFSLAAGRPSTTWLGSLTDLAETIGLWSDAIVWSLYIAIGWLFLVLLLRVILRRQWIAMAVLMVVWVGSWIPGHSNPLLFGIFASVAFAAFLLVVTRFGLLSTVFWALFLYAGQYVVLTLDTSVWYAGRSWLTLLLLAAVACYGFWISLAGRPLIKADLLEER